ncbi:hypothetical protein SAMN04488498_11975 [Mesorhizobium albiziae]|uniref:Uncharacterized protein n=1 Tax=Neomesorhizobium albiziae TaxID=335020 RepID=A0A1I4DUI7_9HYPH|nr:hypothetical protein [Mesorhizobium albiziae]GLS33751.1 hypothetical protein GCM10007937_54630 [Mesorhizobium albiziae]SFK96330.1 hypothetical protein SAMN04488498_11975 [Mesorhizobium albiziae]
MAGKMSDSVATALQTVGIAAMMAEHISATVVVESVKMVIALNAVEYFVSVNAVTNSILAQI